MKSLFVMDPLASLNLGGDSTYMMMGECSRRGHAVWWCQPGDLYAHSGAILARATPVRTQFTPPHFVEGEPVELALGDVDVVWMRKDPPFDMRYVFTTYLLDMAPEATLIVNEAAGLMRFNEKLWAMQYPAMHPETLLTNQMARLRAFVRRHERAVLKPWDGNGGRGVLVTGAKDRNLNSMIELLTEGGVHYVIAQPFLTEADEGDKRILLVDGTPVGAMLRVPSAEDHRGNMHVGATVEAVDLSARDRAICDALAPALRANGMVFVGIDVIGGVMTEINITSPTGIQEINRLHGRTVERTLVDSVEAKLAALREAL